MKRVPWHVKGVRPEVREVARDAARRSGLSVGAWLDSLIVDAAGQHDAAGGDRRQPAPPDPDTRGQPSRIGDAALAAIRKEIDELKRQMSRSQVRPAIFEQRLHDIEARINALPSSTRGDDVAEILRRHFAEFGDTLKGASPVDDIAKVWRQDLVEISATLRDAMPTSVIVALEEQVRALGERLESHRGAEAGTAATADIEQALAAIRDRLQALTPAEELAELNHAVKLLSHKADSIATESSAPEKMQQLEHAIGTLQGIANQVASRDVVAALSQDIKALGDKIDCNSRPTLDSDFMNTLERRLAEIAEAVGHFRPNEAASVPANFEATIKALTDRLEAVQIPTADQGVLKGLEQRLDTLVDKLENSETRMASREGIDRGMDELLTQLRELCAQNENKFVAIQQQLATTASEAISGPADSIRRDVASLKEIQTSVDRRTQDTFEAVYGTIEEMVGRLATIEEGLRDSQYVPHAGQSVDLPGWRGEPSASRVQSAPAMVSEAPTLVPSAAPMADRATTRLRQPVVSDFAPDAPLEPGSAALRVRAVANAIDRIAASEAVNGAAKPPETAAPVRANFVAAARRAAQAVASEQQRTPAARFEKPVADPQRNLQAGALRPRLKSIILSIGMMMLVVGGLCLALVLFHNPWAPESGRPVTRMDDAAQPDGESIPSAPEPLTLEQPPTRQGANLDSPTLPVLLNTNMFTAETALGSAPRSGVLPEVAALATVPRPVAAEPPAMIVGTTAAALPEMAAPATNPRQVVTETPAMILGTTAVAPPEVAAPAAIPRPAVTATPTVIPQTTASVPDMGASSLMRNPLLQAPVGRGRAPQTAAPLAVPTRDLTEIPLPLTIGGTALIAAASAGEPGASYEVATRFAQGHNAPQDPAMAAAWFERAARSGLAPAQFRLGTMYEKGLGIKKDLTEARRLYLAAADKGNAKAMHNLAVLYAEGGLDGKPDYAVASQWFRKAADHGIVDSQYNLAILFARGVGVERNTAEAYKWFAVAAKGGDKEAVRRRDEIAARLDPKQLESAKLNVESFVPEPQPEEAITIKAPAGGWDQVAAATTKAKVTR